MTAKKDPKDLKKAGAKTKYKEEYNEQVEKICKLGSTDAQIANFFNVTETTINNWKIDFPIFFESIKKGKDHFDLNNVENALLKSAMGFDYDEVSETDSSGENGSFSSTKTTNKKVVGNVTAQIFWLKNRQPARWKDKQEVEHIDIDRRGARDFGSTTTTD